MKKIAVLGSTGSIGKQTLEVAAANPDKLQIKVLAAHVNDKLLEEQIEKFAPDMAVLTDEKAAQRLKERYTGKTKILAGREGLLEAVTYDGIDTVLASMVGYAGLLPTLEAIKHGKDIALANKETLVAAGSIVMAAVKQHNVSLTPVDSEHSAIFQSLQGENGNRIAKILLTASGGPFRGKKPEDLAHIQVEDALRHPNWTMGRKITIDSSTLVNKGLEVMEAKWLFDVELEQIEVVVHPQSVIHSAVQYEDGAVIAQLGTPDMRLPIQYALYYPKRRPLSGDRLDLFALGQLTFERPDTETFRGLALAYQAMRRGGNIPTAFNAANEKAVALFLDRKIAYQQIPEMIESCMEVADFIANPTVDEILETEAAAYEHIAGKWGKVFA